MTNINELARQLFQLAETDLIEVQASNIPHSICFFSQQAAEKYLKAFLAYHNEPFPKTHNLDVLITKCAKIDKQFESLRTVCNFLNRFAVNSRYQLVDQAQNADCPVAWQAIISVKNIVVASLPDEIKKKN